jgi:NTE family protein
MFFIQVYCTAMNAALLCGLLNDRPSNSESMKTLIQKLLILMLSAASMAVFALDRPRVGLVLSGGGARGAAHVGVLKVLEEMHIPVDVIAGTSMGSIVGGLYASGLSPAEIEQMMITMDWAYVLEDDQSRGDLSINRKRREDTFSVAISPGFSDGRVKLPPGVIQGQKIDLILQNFTTHVAHINEFDDLPIPFRAVATNIVNGEMVVLSSGNLGRAMRASMSVPSIFAPARIDGKILVDGGIVNNLPIDIARQMGADVLIVVDIGTPLRSEDQINNLLSVTDQLMGLLTNENVIESLASISDEDVLISPDMGEITTTSFDKAEEAIPIGEQAARASFDKLNGLAMSDQDYADYQASIDKVELGDRTVKSINLDNGSRLADEVLRHRIDVKTGEPLSLDQLERDLGQIHGLGTFSRVGYDLRQQQDGVDVDVFATPKSWGPNYLHFGLSMDGDMDGENGTNLLVGYTRTEMNKWAGEWTSLVQVGEEPKIATYFHQPLGYNLNYFIRPLLGTKKTNIGVFTDGDKFAEYRLEEHVAELLVGREFAHSAVLALGINRINGEAEVLIGDPSLDEAKYDDGGIIIKSSYDTRDDIDFPSSGMIARASYYKAHDSLGADEEFDQWRLRYSGFKSFGNNTVALGVTLGGTEDGTASLSRRFLMGGFLNLSGLKRNEISGEYAGLARVVYYRKFDKVKFLPAYVGGSLEYGGAWLDKDDINADNSLLAGSVFLGLDSPLGPVLVGWGNTQGGHNTFFTKIGRFID